MTRLTLTRENLHERVWKEPMAVVAAAFGISAARLESICGKLDVPYPFSGYWNAGAGAAQKVPPLRAPKAGALVSIEIESKELIPVRSQKRSPSRASDAAVPVPKSPAHSTRLSKPHRLVAARLEEERRLNMSWGGLGRAQRRETEVQRRTRSVEDLLLKAAERAGHKVELVDHSLYHLNIVIDGQRISYSIRERYTQKRRPLTAEELREPENIRSGRLWSQAQVLTGELRLTADAKAAWEKASWQDKADRPLEDQMDEIVRGLEDLAAKAKDTLARRLEEERRRQEEQARRYELERRVKKDDNQWRRLRELAAKSEEAQRMRSFLAQLRKQLATEEMTEEFSAWLSWAENRAENWDPLTRGSRAVMAEVKSVTEYG